MNPTAAVPPPHAVSTSGSGLPLSIDVLLERSVELGRIGPAHHRRLEAGRARARAHRGPRGLLRARSRDDAAAHLPDHDDRAAEEPRAQPAARLRVRRARARPLPDRRLLPARGAGGRLPHDPHRHPVDRGARPAAGAARVHDEAARARPLHRADRLGQVDLAGRADRRDQPGAPRPHHHDRGPDRVPAPAQELHRQPARDRRRRTWASPRRSAVRSARTPT